MDDIDIANYADGNTPYVTADDIDGVIASLENVSNNLFKWFSDNLFKGNTDKCHLLVNVKDKVSMKIGDFNIVNCKCEMCHSRIDNTKIIRRFFTFLFHNKFNLSTVLWWRGVLCV